MKTKFGLVITDGRGKLGGHVASKNRSGNYLRTKVTPVNPQTSFQTAVRNRLSGLSQAWRGITNAQRIAWNAAVGSFSKTNIFGDVVNPSGFNLFCSLNNNLLLTGGAQIDTPPAPAAVEDIIIGALSGVPSTGVISLAYTAGAAGSTIVVFATAPVSAGKSFVKSEYRKIGSFASETASPYVATAPYATKFGAITDALGQKIFFKTVAINDTTGQAGVPQTAVAILAE